MADQEISTGEIYRMLVDLRASISAIEAKFVNRDRYEADIRTATSERLSLARTVSDDTSELKRRMDEFEAGRRRLLGLAFSAFLVPLLVALIAAGIGKGSF